MKRHFHWLLLFLVVSSCAPRVATPAGSSIAAADPLARLRLELDRKFSDANFSNANWGVEIVSLERGDTLYERNSSRLFVPASNNKLVTAAAALLRLGPEYSFETLVETDGQIVADTLKGDLVVIGRGDPTAAPRFHSGDPFRVFKDWAGKLKEKGIRAIEGDLVGDDSAFEPGALGKGWQWDDLVYGYAVPVTALQFNENAAIVEIAPAARQGDRAIATSRPLSQYVSLQSVVVTGAPGSESRIEFEGGEAKESITVRGSIPLNGEPVIQAVAVRLPTQYYLRALSDTLASEGIDISKCGIRSVRDYPVLGLTLLWKESSLPLSEIIKPMLKVSQNLYAETLVRELGFAIAHEGSFAKGKEIVEQVLRGMGIEPGAYSFADGSGMSRLNLISPDQLVRVLSFVYRQKNFPVFYEALPIAAVDGTIAGRMKGTRAENNVRAKTGMVGSVRALSGYVRTADGEMLAFSMIANNFLVSATAAEYVQDAACNLLANFTRR